MSNYLFPKIDTKEKMHIITFKSEQLDAKMAEELTGTVFSYLNKEIRNVVLNFENVTGIDDAIANEFLSMQKHFHDEKASLVFCNFTNSIIDKLKDTDIFDTLNYTPTESEAWDIVQMEEMERELLG